MYCVPFLAIRGPRLASSILFQSSGMTNGIVEERDIPEELPKQKERKKEEEGEDYENTDSDQESVDEEADVSMLSKTNGKRWKVEIKYFITDYQKAPYNLGIQVF